MKQGQRGPAGPRLPKMPVLQDFQFFNTARIQELVEKQHAYELFLHEKKREAAETKVDGSSQSFWAPCFEAHSLFF